MIRNSFIFLDKIGKTTEDNMRESGIKTWDDFLSAKNVKGVSPHRKAYYNRMIDKAKKNLYGLNSSYFDEIIPKTEHWRLYDFFKDDVVFLDIETTGLSDYNYITMVGLYDGIDTKIMIKDINLDWDHLKEELKKYKMMVTFNGTVFDAPFIEKRHPGVLPNIPHFDLRFACNKLGIKGGLKDIEKLFGIQRRELVGDLTGGDALRLWKMYKNSGDDHYLNLLVEYNEEDIINLKKIADDVYQQLKTKLL
jgi:uncharacterized protein YprB with RNaseH-like and TPR domain